MASRGAYAKGVAKREHILTTALDVIAENGYRKTSIRELAAAVGLSQTGLLHYFGTKEELFAEILLKRDDVDTGPSGAVQAHLAAGGSVVGGLEAVARHNTEVPGLVQLYAQFSAEAAADPLHPAHARFQERYRQFRRQLAELIRETQARGELPASLDADRMATLLAAASDGLQVQWMLDPTIDMADHIGYLWQLALAAQPAEVS